jgi:putative DNA methylase
MMAGYRKKLIEVALPLPEINDASAYDKMPGIGPHPKGIHHWWARLPLPTARAVLYASVVDDPEAHPEKWVTEEAQNTERERLFDILRRMMGKKLHAAREVYAEARAEMLRDCGGICRHCLIRSPAAVQSHWRRTGLVSNPTQVT